MVKAVLSSESFNLFYFYRKLEKGQVEEIANLHPSDAKCHTQPR